MKKLFFLLPLIFFLTGCYNYRELNDLAIVSGISINKTDDIYQVTAEVVNPKKQQDASNSNEPDFIIYKSTGDSLQEALRKVVKEAPKKLYGAQIDILIIDEELAKNDLKSIFEFFARDPEIRSEFYVLVGKDTELLEATTPLENISSKKILESLKSSSDYFGNSNLVTYHDLINQFLNPNLEIVLPSIEIVGNEKAAEGLNNIETTTSEAVSVISDLAIFKNNKLIGYLSEEDSIMYNLIMGNSKTPLIRTEYDNNQYVVNEIINYKSGIEVNVKDKKITISVKGKANIVELNYDCNLEDEKTIEQLQKDLNEEIEKKIKDSMNNTRKKFNSDIYGIRDLFYKKSPKEYNKMKENWYDDIYKYLKIEVKSKIELFEKGNLNGGIYHESK